MPFSTGNNYPFLNLQAQPEMKKTIFVLFLGLLANLAFSQGKVDRENIVIGKVDSVQSKILSENRKIWVHVPDGGVNSKERYPVVYVLDGDGHFSSVVGMIQQLSTGGNNNCPKMIVVAIPNTDRTRDLTPTHIDADPPFMDSTFSKTSGGGENFIAFIEKELMPHIEAKYPAAPYKMLIGHSFGGLAVMQTFTHHTQLFNAYICIDPSMWWDKQTLLKQTEKALAERKFEGKSLYLGIANTLEEGMDIKTVQLDTSEDSRHIRSILKLQAAFEKNKQNGLQYRSKYYPDDTHGSVPFITEYDALRFFFDFFPLKLTMEDFTDSTGALAEKYQNHFAQLSRKMGYPIKPDEGEINFIGYDFLGRKMYKTAGRLFKLNVDNYPESYNVYDSYGDYFVAIKDTANAILQFKKALSVKENEGSREKLEALAGVSKTPPIGEALPLEESNADLLRIAELDKTYWAEISRTVKEGDFESYKATCHENAILVATAGKNKRSEPMTVALARWKQGFIDTRQGKQMDNVSFRFSQRIGSETTAHETGIFYFSSHDATGKLLSEAYIHFEELLVKQDGKWQCMMEYQKSVATKEEWDALK